mmetsp:Transcript_44525/g.107278  ORF Transcript_44525/g.107278 Transcript_44525/m.107278 type:complete len:81 (+) Transcript_44525:113-355(+)
MSSNKVPRLVVEQIHCIAISWHHLCLGLVRSVVVDKLSLAALAAAGSSGRSYRCDDGDWNGGNGGSSLQSSKSLGFVSSN